jgi:hypothetical protein
MSLLVALHAISDCVNETYNEEQEFRRIFFKIHIYQIDCPRSESTAAWKKVGGFSPDCSKALFGTYEAMPYFIFTR